jgi:glycosyltransferase involved in cell wall biosynthesis
MSINLTCPINQLGYGVVSTNALMSLTALGQKVALWPLGPIDCSANKQKAVTEALERATNYDRMAPSLKIWHQFDLAHHIGKGVHAGVPYFEVDRLRPREVTQLNAQDVVFASSTWMKQVMEANGVRTNIRVASPGVDASIFRTARSSSTTTTFVCVGKWEVRKGHDIVVDVFNRAFTESDDVSLLMLTANPFLDQKASEQWVNTYKRSRLGSKIRVIPERLPTQNDVARVMAEADCGVFLSRAEGWNLDLAEMMAMGKHVIATNFAAHTEFVTGENALLVEIDRTEEAFDGKWFHGFGEWAALGNRQIEQAVAHMQSIHRDKQSGRLDSNEAGIATMNRFTWERFAQDIIAGLGV